MATAARVTVIVPCYNDGATLPETLDSIAEREPVEVVVVDDGSSDPATSETLAAVGERAGVRVFRHPHNRGLPAARNTGLQAAKTPYVFALDSDDLAVEGSLTRMADLLDRSGATACYGEWVQFGTHERICRPPQQFDPYRIAYRNEYPVASMFRTDSIRRLGGWRDVGGMVGYEDWNLWMTLAENGERVVYAEGVTAFRYRVHGVRMFREAARNHRRLYKQLREDHRRLFDDIAVHRSRSTLPPLRRAIYPIAFGYRGPLGLRRRAESAVAAVRAAVGL